MQASKFNITELVTIHLYGQGTFKGKISGIKMSEDIEYDVANERGKDIFSFKESEVTTVSQSNGRLDLFIV